MHVLEFQGATIRALANHKIVSHIIAQHFPNEFKKHVFWGRVYFENTEIRDRNGKSATFEGYLSYEVSTSTIRYAISMGLKGDSRLSYKKEGAKPFNPDLPTLGQVVGDLVKEGLDSVSSQLDKLGVTYNSDKFIRGIGDGLVYIDKKTPSVFGGYSLHKCGSVILETTALNSVYLHIDNHRNRLKIETMDEDFELVYDLSTGMHKADSFKNVLLAVEHLLNTNKQAIKEYTEQ